MTRHGIYLVQKRHVREVRLFDSSPLPVTHHSESQED
jgi:hypothetical protein